MHRCPERLPTLDGNHHEPPVVTVPLPLAPVLAELLEPEMLDESELDKVLELSELSVVELEPSVELTAAVVDDVDRPAYEAAAT
jgi:hypothetical protein